MGRKYVYRPGHPMASERGFVDVEDLGWEPIALAKHAAVMVDWFYENTKATDGTDIGSRRKHREYMKAHGLTTADDFKETWKQAAAEREKMSRGDFDHKDRRETIGRAIYERSKRHG